MARTSWMDDNCNRSFPFVPGAGSVVPNAALADYGGLMGIRSGYEEAVHSTWLQSVTRYGDWVTFRFRSDAPGLTAHELVFAFSYYDLRYTCQFVEATLIEGEPHSLSLSDVIDERCTDDALWSGYLVMGDLTSLATIIADGQTLEDGTTVEPAITRSLVGTYVRSVNLANTDRTRATTPAQCQQLTTCTADVMHVRASCLVGDLRLVAGYNCKVVQDVLANSLTIGALDPAVEATVAGQPCEESPLFAAETAPAGRTRLDGALNCDEVFRSVNGLGGPVVQIASGNGVNITFDTEQHQILVDLNMHNMAAGKLFNESLPDASISCSMHTGPDFNTDCGLLGA